MISFKSFVQAIHDAILKANEALMDKNASLLKTYFKEKTVEEKDKDGNLKQVKVQEPVSVILDYPIIKDDGKQENIKVHVPLITLVPMSTTQIEKATLTADFEMDIIDGDLQIHFAEGKKGNMFKDSKKSKGTLEITVTPQETTEGLKHIIEGYEKVIKRQIP